MFPPLPEQYSHLVERRGLMSSARCPECTWWTYGISENYVGHLLVQHLNFVHDGEYL